MSYTRKIRVEYFRVVIAKKNGTGQDKDFNLEQLLKKIDAISMNARIINYYQEEARLEKMKYENSTGYWYLNFTRLRQTKIPLRARRNKEAESFYLDEDEYIGEDVTALYDPTNNIFVLQRNRDSLSATGIEYYLTQLYDQDDYGIYLRSIIDTNIEEKLKRAKSYRKVTLKFDTNRRKKKVILPNTSLAHLADLFNKYDSNVATLTLSLGKGNAKGSLDASSIVDTISEIKESKDFITGAELNVKYNEIDPVDTIDLFTMKYFDIIGIKVEKRETIPYLEIGEEICKKYNTRKKELIE